MLETLQYWDTGLFQVVNQHLGNPFFDALLPWCRERWFWAPAYLFVVAFAVLNYGWRGWLVVLGLVFAVGLTDFTSSSLVKKNVHRLRPCNNPEMLDKINLRVDCGSGYSFTSSHAANHFAAAVFLITVFGGLSPRIRPIALGWAGLIAFSQVYVGVHYPADVVCGALLGAAIGWWAALTFKRLFSWRLAA